MLETDYAQRQVRSSRVPTDSVWSSSYTRLNEWSCELCPEAGSLFQSTHWFSVKQQLYKTEACWNSRSWELSEDLILTVGVLSITRPSTRDLWFWTEQPIEPPVIINLLFTTGTHIQYPINRPPGLNRGKHGMVWGRNSVRMSSSHKFYLPLLQTWSLSRPGFQTRIWNLELTISGNFP